jgi:Ca2+-binding EF-hand superfamily protein
MAGVVSGVVGGLIGSWWTSRRMKKSQEKEKKELLRYIQYQEELAKATSAQWQKEYQKLYDAYAEMEKDTIERDYEEFKAPDRDGDDIISREEFNVYVKKYLSSFPELSERDFPRFEEFDMNSDGKVTFDEWQTFLYEQKIKEQAAAKNKVAGSKEDDAYSNLMNAIYESSSQSDGFSSLQKNVASNQRGARGRV